MLGFLFALFHYHLAGFSHGEAGDILQGLCLPLFQRLGVLKGLLYLRFLGRQLALSLFLGLYLELQLLFPLDVPSL